MHHYFLPAQTPAFRITPSSLTLVVSPTPSHPALTLSSLSTSPTVLSLPSQTFSSTLSTLINSACISALSTFVRHNSPISSFTISSDCLHCSGSGHTRRGDTLFTVPVSSQSFMFVLSTV